MSLAALAPWMAEASWGGYPVTYYPTLVLFGATFYGMAALIIREVSRRWSGGWPAIILLAAAFGVIQAGVVDQSLFNVDYLDDTQFDATQSEAARTSVPVIGVSLSQVLDYVGNHIALSIAAPIALVEAFAPPAYRDRPWLSRGALVAMAPVYLLGSAMIFLDDDGRKGFTAAPGQLAGALVIAAVVITLARLPRWRRSPAALPGRVPAPLVVGLVALIPFFNSLSSNWTGQLLRIAVWIAFVIAVLRYSRRAGWSRRHTLAVWSAGLVSVAASVLAVPTYFPVPPSIALLSDIIVMALAATLISVGFWRLRQRPA
ncbi:hypothetical protein GCM10010201_02540 [Pilimelia columellifera subsp. columellifera]|uniref:Uncharacterized protein n=1 Tax=Pilimelia columellifera subsp. columellifera TaxID=706583 RepID=A0ABP6A5Y0_9ACTN